MLAQNPLLPINLTHHDIQRAHNRRYICDQATLAEGIGDRKIAERAAAGPCPPGDRFARTDEVKTHLALRAFGFQITFAFR